MVAPTQPVSIRAARLSDADAVARLSAQLGYTPEPAAVVARLQRILARTDQQFFVAAIGSSVVGWVHTLVSEYVEAEAFVVIGGLVVDHDHRRLGVGRALMEHAEQWALSQGCSLVRLWSSERRTAAHQFYRNLGYAHVKTQLSFIKSLEEHGRDRIEQFVPRVVE